MKKISSVLLLGSGALKIGEAGEFDYSGSQAIKALKEKGIRIILVNPNIATVQTSAGMADIVYYLPVEPTIVARIIAKERPDGILLSFGGQTALNCGLALEKHGILKKYAVRILGTPIQAVDITEDRTKFAKHLHMLGLKTAKGKIVRSVRDAQRAATLLGYPVMLRTGFALGGSGSGIAKNNMELTALVSHALATSTQIIIEECLFGWKEIEYEVVRDAHDNCITVCNMENMDPVGIHTGESIVVAPSQTLNSQEYYTLRKMSIDVIRSLRIIGECNIQYALNPKTGDYRIIEVNARLSRSSALASKATGYPLAYIAAKLALGDLLTDLQNSMTKKTSAFFEPSLDYCVVKLPRWDLDKFTGVETQIGSEMKSVGEVMAIGRTFEEAIQKAARELNDGYRGVIDTRFVVEKRSTLLNKLKNSNSQRLFIICSALYSGISFKTIQNITHIDPWFISKLSIIVELFRKINGAKQISVELLKSAKQAGFSDRQIANATGQNEEKLRKRRKNQGIVPVIKRIDTMAGEFPVNTNYLYCTYHGVVSDRKPKKEKKAIVLGCGPYAIGTSVEFDWCAVFTARGLRKRKYKAIVINCNPETVSTDYDESDYLYFEELTLERVLDIYDIERAPVIVSVGGQIPNNLAPMLSRNNVQIIGTKTDDILRSEDRKIFSTLLDGLGIRQPQWGTVTSSAQAHKLAKTMGYPVMVRPSFVLSGKSMRIILTEEDLGNLSYPLTMTKFISDAQECDFDGVASNGNIITSALSEHVEKGGVHSGDSSLMIPAPTLSPLVRSVIEETSAGIVQSLHIHGPFNIQYLISGDNIYVIECNLRASRSVPFVSKATGINFIEIATDVMLGIPKTIQPEQMLPYTVVKVPQFSFRKLRGADPVLHVEMASTGEVSAFGRDMWEAFVIATLATGIRYPTRKTAFLSLGGFKGKLEFLKGAHLLDLMKYTIYATEGTSLFLNENGIPSVPVRKIHEPGRRKTIVDIMSGKGLDFAVVTTQSQPQAKTITDGFIMRRFAIDLGIPVFTNAENARFFIEGIRRYSPQNIAIKSWQDYIQTAVNIKEEGYVKK